MAFKDAKPFKKGDKKEDMPFKKGAEGAPEEKGGKESGFKKAQKNAKKKCKGKKC